MIQSKAMNNELRIREGIEKYLRDSFKKDSVGLISKLFGESAEYLYAISKIETSEYTDYFKSFDLIWVHVNESYLDKSFIPSTQSYGLFAVNEKKSLHLVHTKPENLTVLLRDDLLREENIKEIPAYILAP